jgi:hypothetical protein
VCLVELWHRNAAERLKSLRVDDLHPNEGGKALWARRRRCTITAHPSMAAAVDDSFQRLHDLTD